MSAEGVGRARRLRSDATASRALALLGAALLTGAYVSVLHYVTTVVGGSGDLLAAVAAAAVAGVVLARLVRPWLAFLLGVALVVLGLLWYVFAIPNGVQLLASTDQVVSDTVALLTGLSVLRMTKAGVWALGIAPGPVFLTAYFSVRRRYVGAAAVGGATLGLFVLTGDASTPLALLGVVGAAGLVGFGELDRHGGTTAQAEVLTVVLAAMVAVPLVVSVVPGGAANPWMLSSGGGTVESSLLTANDRVDVVGSIRLSPKVRFTVDSPRAEYWQVGAYDRYTGGGWVRTGERRAFGGGLAAPPGPARPLRQTFRAETAVDTMPAAWKPVSVFGPGADDARVTGQGSLQSADALAAGERYGVVSQVPSPTPDQLRRAGTDYPEPIRERYLQLPSNTPDRVGERTAQLTANADNPYDTARVVERWLRESKGYSLTVDRPRGNIADAFLFEMDRGYCTYFATTMVTMLRTQGIPARFVVGYTSGQQVGTDEYVVRGLDSHAWVQAYFPEYGWVRFDPTPPDDRERAERQRLSQARQANESDVDTGDSRDDPLTPPPTTAPPTTATPPGNRTATNGSGPGTATPGLPGLDPGSGNGTPAAPTETVAPLNGSGDPGRSPSLPPPSRELVALGLVVLAGLAAGAHRSGAAERAYRLGWLHWRPDGTPAERVEGAYARVEYLLERRHRPRRSGETPRQYLAAVGADERARRVGAIRERARYAGEVSADEATETTRLAAELARERTPFLGRLRGGSGRPESR